MGRYEEKKYNEDLDCFEIVQFSVKEPQASYDKESIMRFRNARVQRYCEAL